METQFHGRCSAQRYLASLFPHFWRCVWPARGCACGALWLRGAARGHAYTGDGERHQSEESLGADENVGTACEIATEFGRAEGQAFVNGTGVNRPKAFLNNPISTAKDGVRPFGTLQYLPSGAAGAFGNGEEDRLVDLVQSLRAPYRQGACFVMNAATSARIRKMKTTDGQFLWAPGLAAGQPATLLGYPVVEAEDMPDIAENSCAIAFGNFQAGYLIAQRRETVVLRDPFSNKPYVHFYATKRVGGTVIDSRAIKLMKFSA
jgi:HK97 family phage major capsid protein